jgi:hypothetical protein
MFWQVERNVLVGGGMCPDRKEERIQAKWRNMFWQVEISVLAGKRNVSRQEGGICSGRYKEVSWQEGGMCIQSTAYRKTARHDIAKRGVTF